MADRPDQEAHDRQVARWHSPMVLTLQAREVNMIMMALAADVRGDLESLLDLHDPDEVDPEIVMDVTVAMGGTIMLRNQLHEQLHQHLVEWDEAHR